MKPKTTKTRPYLIELRHGKVRYFYRIVAPNGEPIMTSQKYFSKGNCKAEAYKLAEAFNLMYVEVTNGKDLK